MDNLFLFFSRLQEALADLAVLQDEKKEWEFREELKTINEINVRPVTPSKIPVGSWRVEEEKELNRALAGNGLLDSNRSTHDQQFYARESAVQSALNKQPFCVLQKLLYIETILC